MSESYMYYGHYGVEHLNGGCSEAVIRRNVVAIKRVFFWTPYYHVLLCECSSKATSDMKRNSASERRLRHLTNVGWRMDI